MKRLAPGEFARIFGGVIVLLSIMLGVLAVIQALALSPIWSKDADGAGWVGAIGTIGTLIWAGMHASIQSACINIDSIISEIDDAMLSPSNLFRSGEAIQKLEVIKQIGDVDLTRLVALPNSFAIHLAETIGHLTHLIVYIRSEFPQPIHIRAPRSDELSALSSINSTLHVLYEDFARLDYECRSSKRALYESAPVQAE